MGNLLTHVQGGGEMNMMKMKSDKVSVVHSQCFSLLVNPSIPTSYPALVELGSLTLIHI